MKAKVIKRINQIFHEEEAEFYDKRHPDIVKEAQSWKHVLNKYLGPNKNLKVLDVGTGTGFIPSIISEYTSSLIICSDISKKMLDVAKTKLSLVSKTQFEFIVCDAEKLPLRNSSIDIITINSTLHHLPDYRSCLDEASRILCTNGVIFIMHEPNKAFYNNRVLSNLNRALRLYLSARNRALRFMTSKSINASTNNRPNLFERVNQRLIAENLTCRRLSPREIQVLVDIHSPTASGIPDKTKGITLFEVMRCGSFKLLEFKTYNFLGKIDPSRDKLLSPLNFVCSKVLRNKGYMFWMVLQKE